MKYVHTPRSAGKVEAVQWTGDNIEEFREAFPDQTFSKKIDGRLEITGKGGTSLVDKGDYTTRVADHDDKENLWLMPKEEFEDTHLPLEEVEIREKADKKHRYEQAKKIIEQYEGEEPEYVEIESPNTAAVQGDENAPMLVMDDDGWFQLVHRGHRIPYNLDMVIKDNAAETATVTATFKIRKGRKA